MIICVCKNVKKNEIEQLAATGAGIKSIQKCSQAGTDCGACIADIKLMINARKSSTPSHGQERSD